MGRVYTATFAGVAATAVQDLFVIPSASTQIIKVLSCFIGQSSDEADAQAEMLRIRIRRASGAYAVGSGGSAPSVNPHRFGDSAFSGAVRANDTTQGSGGTITTVMEETFNVQAGWYYTPTPEEQIVLSVSQFFIVDWPGAPTDELTISGRITFDVEGAA